MEPSHGTLEWGGTRLQEVLGPCCALFFLPASPFQSMSASSKLCGNGEVRVKLLLLAVVCKRFVLRQFKSLPHRGCSVTDKYMAMHGVFGSSALLQGSRKRRR